MIIGVVVTTLLVRDAAGAELREVLQLEVAIVDHERVTIVLAGLHDLAERVDGRREVAGLRAEDAAKVERRRVEARLAADLAELVLGGGLVALFVRGAAAQVITLA